MSETILWGDLLSAHGNARSAETTAADARQHRDQLVADLVAAGVSMYRVAKVLGVSESGVRKIVDRGRAGVGSLYSVPEKVRYEDPDGFSWQVDVKHAQPTGEVTVG